MSCDQSLLGITKSDGRNSHQLYETAKGGLIRSLHVDWMSDMVLWLEDERLLAISGAGGQAKELLHLVGVGKRVDVVFDVAANSLLWNSKQDGRWRFSVLLWA